MIAHALDIERLANAMAATRGTRLPDVSEEDRSALRVYASACLIRLGVDAKAEGKAHLAAELNGIGETLRLAAMSLEAVGSVPEEKLAALHRYASRAEVLAAVLLGMEPATAAPPPAHPAPVEEEAV